MATKKQREFLYKKTNGRCGYCGCELPDRWHVDHIEPVRRNPDGSVYHKQRDVIDNMMAACPSCNNFKHTFTLERFRFAISEQIRCLNEHQTTYRLAKRFGLIKETQKPIVFYFETLVCGEGE